MPYLFVSASEIMNWDTNKSMRKYSVLLGSQSGTKAVWIPAVWRGLDMTTHRFTFSTKQFWCFVSPHGKIASAFVSTAAASVSTPESAASVPTSIAAYPTNVHGIQTQMLGVLYIGRQVWRSPGSLRDSGAQCVGWWLFCASYEFWAYNCHVLPYLWQVGIFKL